MRKSISKKVPTQQELKRSSSKIKKKAAAKKKASAKQTSSKSSSKVDFSVIEEYLGFMEARGLNELEYSVPSLAIKLKRGGGEAPAMTMPAPAMVPGHSPSISNAASQAQTSDAHIVKSPFVGTFYRAAGPNQEPFIEEGKTVGSGAVLCIVEAMKLMNEIESDIKGRIKKILVKDATPVEFGEPLFEIDPS